MILRLNNGLSHQKQFSFQQINKLKEEYQKVTKIMHLIRDSVQQTKAWVHIYLLGGLEVTDCF